MKIEVKAESPLECVAITPAITTKLDPLEPENAFENMLEKHTGKTSISTSEATPTLPLNSKAPALSTESHRSKKYSQNTFKNYVVNTNRIQFTTPSSVFHISPLKTTQVCQISAVANSALNTETTTILARALGASTQNNSNTPQIPILHDHMANSTQNNQYVFMPRKLGNLDNARINSVNPLITFIPQHPSNCMKDPVQICAENYAIVHNVPINKPPVYKNPFKYPSLAATGDVQNNNPEPQSAHPNNDVRSKIKTKEILGTDEWKCLICSEIKDTKDALIDHYEFHKEEKDKLEKEKNADADSKNGTSVDSFQCPVCPKQFQVLTTYERHVNIEHGEKQFYCTSCRFLYTNALSLSLHNMYKHATVPEQYTCCVCKTFTTKSVQKLRRHISDTHDNNTYKCEVCQKTFTSLTWLRDHKIFHIDTSAFECEICKKKFPSSWQLIAHNKRVHEGKTGGVMKLECEKCNLTFASKKALLRHISIHSQEATLCFICGKIFGNENKLGLHLKMHGGIKKFVCNICGGQFRKSNTLTNHLRTHSGEKPYKCTTCGKCFSQRSSLVIHQRHHTGETPYVCHSCNKGYASKSALSIHRRRCK